MAGKMTHARVGETRAKSAGGSAPAVVSAPKAKKPANVSAAVMQPDFGHDFGSVRVASNQPNRVSSGISSDVVHRDLLDDFDPSEMMKMAGDLGGGGMGSMAGMAGGMGGGIAGMAGNLGDSLPDLGSMAGGGGLDLGGMLGDMGDVGPMLDGGMTGTGGFGDISGMLGDMPGMPDIEDLDLTM